MFAITKRLLLRPAWPEDSYALTKALADVEVVRHLSGRIPWPYTHDDACVFIARVRGLRLPDVLIFRRPSGGKEKAKHGLDLIGGIGLHHEDGVAHLGYWLARDAWGQGYATEAGQALLACARHGLGHRTINATCFADNPRSRAVLERLGFTPVAEVSLDGNALRGAGPHPGLRLTLVL